MLFRMIQEAMRHRDLLQEVLWEWPLEKNTNYAHVVTTYGNVTVSVTLLK